MGADHVLFGSDFPHPEGIGDPLDFLDRLAGVDDETTEKIMGGNLAGLLGVKATV